MAEVFISFIHEEVAYAECVRNFISQVLITESFTGAIIPFMSSDKFLVYAGEKWLDRIMDELAGAKVVILMLSKKSVMRPWVNFEAGAAWTRRIVTIPVCYGGLLKEQLPKPYSSLQAVDLESPDDHEYLARSIAHYLGIAEPMRLMLGLAALGGEKSKSKAEQQEAAFSEFETTLAELRKPRPDFI